MHLLEIGEGLGTMAHKLRPNSPALNGPSIKFVIVITSLFLLSNSMKLGEVLVNINNSNFTNFD